MTDSNKLHIDDDWKAQAAKEKEQLAETTQAPPAKGLPEANFSSLVELLAMQAMVGLGGYRGPGGQVIPPNIEVAKHHIDMLDVLDRISRGNLTPEEKKLLDTALHQLRMAYVETLRVQMPQQPGS